MNSFWPVLLGCFLGFFFGVGCALAVMYSIYMGGYRAALRDVASEAAPERLVRARKRLRMEAGKVGARAEVQGSGAGRVGAGGLVQGGPVQIEAVQSTAAAGGAESGRQA